MSTIADIFSSYRDALMQSRDRYTELYVERVENGRQFYQEFFNRLVVPFRQVFAKSASRSFILRQVERFFGTNQIDFVAIDGTCQRDAFADFVVFFGGAYGAKGRVSLAGDPPKIKYEKWEMNRDVSIVAWVPVPFAELADVAGASLEENFMVTDADRANLSRIHTSLVQLAEIYLAYNVATSSAIDAPKLIMLDQSLSGMMAATSHGVDTGLVGYPYDRRQLDQADVTIAFAHPFSPELGIPSTKRFRRYTAVLAEFHKRNTKQLRLSELESALGLTREGLHEPADFLLNRAKLCTYDTETHSLATVVDCRESWAYTVSLFQNICARLFLHKDASALTYEAPDPEDPMKKRRRWMSPEDIQFLIAVGLRALIEECWQRRIMLVGVVKDSESRYLTRNYLGVMKHLGVYPMLQEHKFGLLPWTDRIYLETIPLYCDEQLEAPWASIEFDSTFMTLHLGRDGNVRPQVMGVRSRAGEMVASERLFVRSLAQFFMSRHKKTPLMGHVIFLDRLASPVWDKDAFGEVCIESPSLGRIDPIVYKDRDALNVGQMIVMYLLSTLSRNHFPEVIGYPDLLHKATGNRVEIPCRCRCRTGPPVLT
ncbi:MAG TPA: hypothetical protein EYP63_04310 [Desulfotomaculum sp.]|nr:hypothetical protein [Desulfotomaculum sp.]